MEISSSSSSIASCSYPTTCKRKYDVFLNFRGEDTRINFTSHLHDALLKNNILTFIDNELVRGEALSPSLLKAIEESKISVVILSENYPYSKWCLEELVKILECMKINGQMVIPVFYKVDPSHVRNQTGSFADAFARHEESLLVTEDKVKSWRAALKDVANISGWDSRVTSPESELIKKIIRDIWEKLNIMSSSYSPRGFVGIQTRIKQIECLLCLKLSDVRIVGIWGMGGIGKTTLARAIYDKISHQFESSCFLSNIREQLERCTLPQLRDELFSSLLEKEILTPSTLNLRLSFIKDRLCRKKVLVVIDDADSLTQLQELLLESEPDYFGSGSRIIITSRDKQVLRNIARDKIYTMQKLKNHEALQLFSLNAFKQDYPTSDRCILQSERVIKYAKGNPLAIRVLGSALFNRSEEDWESALERLGKIPNKEIDNVLRTSYDGLDSDEQNIFLDIVCFFRGEHRGLVTKILDGCYPSAHIVITTLIDRSLITVSYGYLKLHDLLQEMGRNIVLNESKIPESHSRLWIPEDVCYVLKENKGTEVIEGISLDISKARSELRLRSNTFARMSRLRFLNLYRSPHDRDKKDKLQLSLDGLQTLPTELRHLHWSEFPLKSLPSNFTPENLVVLSLPDSKLKKLWTGIQNLVKLKEIDLSGSEYLYRIPDLSKATNIEKIDLWGCESLEEVHSSIQYLNKLEFLDIGECYNLRRLPGRIDSEVLKVFKVNDCPRIKRCPQFQGNLEELELDCTAITDVATTISSILISSTLVQLAVYNCGKLSSLPSSFYKLKSLESLDLDNWSELESFPEILEPMINLEFITLRNCRRLKRLPNSICNLKSLAYLDVEGAAIKEIPSSIEHLILLTTLKLNDCKDLESLPCSIHKLPQLQTLELYSCKSLRSLPEFPLSLLRLLAMNCESLETISISFNKHCNLRILTFANCLRLDPKALGTVARAASSHTDFFLLYPGSEIPRWFSHQSMGSSVTLQFPVNLKQFKAIAFCVVFKFKIPPKKSGDYYFIARCVEDCDKAVFQPARLGSYTFSFVETTHVLIWHESPGYLNDYSGTISSFDFYPCKDQRNGEFAKYQVGYYPWSDERYGEITKDCRVNRCGVSLIQ
ncbi:leucine-rich repeat containing protein, putative [Ricinus communis]|uniref:Leucine-rich repeat containing protein, putative n=1 Tax=Ricinus communis TaxID=3988 RepID=B9RYC7_RICCO|nr:leucine-rich repeat containing protein, putative [Ricinus communis]|eukprot:XP_002518711.1 disease resistance-like protein DSC1 isoform X1 [Ricinus communis]